MPNDDHSLASANSYLTKDVTPSLNCSSASTSPTQDSEKSLDVDSVHPKQARQYLGYCEPQEDKINSYVFAPRLRFEYDFYTAQSEYTELPQPDFWQLRLRVKTIRETSQAKDSTDPIIAACDRFLTMYTHSQHMPSKEDYLASWQ
jgi:hypothetical protein